MIELRQVYKYFSVRAGLFAPVTKLQAVNGVSLSVNQGECVGLVGESGCGKSTLGRIACGLIAPDKGNVFFQGQELPLAGSHSPFAGRIQMVFQDPFSSLDPRMRVGDSVAEALAGEGKVERVAEAFKRIGLAGMERRYPHEFSGGQRQRIAIARALVSRPDFVVCDEPVSALDASVQAQVLNLMLDLQEEFGQAMLFISHNLAVIGFMCQRLYVMYLGELVEELTKSQLEQGAAHPYTQALCKAMPDFLSGDDSAIALQGELPSPLNPPSGCRFHTRCPYVQALCKEEAPDWKELAPGWRVRCHFSQRKV